MGVAPLDADFHCASGDIKITFLKKWTYALFLCSGSIALGQRLVKFTTIREKQNNFERTTAPR